MSMKLLKKLGIGLGIVILSILVIIISAGVFLHESRPEGQAGAKADELASQMMEAVDCAAWDTLEVISWNFGGRNQHLWDKNRHLDRLIYGEYEVLIDLNSRWGIVKKNGQRVDDSKARKILDKAWASWANDSFWLNPVCKAFDEGTDRYLVDIEGEESAVMVSYRSGGVTPGDSYLWILDKNFRPKKWKMWVKIIPIGGVASTWENWQTLYNGAQVASTHAMSFGDFQLELTQINAGTAEKMYSDGDPFQELVGNQ